MSSNTGKHMVVSAGEAAAAALTAIHRPRLVVPPGAAPVDSPIGIPGGPPPGAPSPWNAKSGATEWGDPMHELISAEGTSGGDVDPGDAAQESSSAWGRQVNVMPGGPKVGAIRVFTKHSQDFTLSFDVLQEAQATIGLVRSRWFVWALVTFGNGGTNVQRKVRCDFRIDAPLACSYCDVLLYVGDYLGNPIDPTEIVGDPTPAIVVAQLSRGIRGLPYSATIFNCGVGNAANASISPYTDQGVLLDAPQRLMSVSAHLVADSQGSRFLQLYDKTSADFAQGTPYSEFCLGSTPSGSDIGKLTRFENPRGWVEGIFWIVSSTGGVFTACDDEIWIELETQSL